MQYGILDWILYGRGKNDIKDIIGSIDKTGIQPADDYKTISLFLRKPH